eukprot:RCo044008
MAASFRNTGEIKQLCGCDYVTVSPALLQELSADPGEVPQVLSASKAAGECQEAQLHLGEKEFRWMLNEDAMATEKLAEGIRAFARDARKLEEILLNKLRA